MDVTKSSTRWFFALLLGCLTAIGPLSIDMYLPAFPNIAEDLNVSSGEVQLTLSAYLLGVAIFQLVYGPLSDRAGRRVPLLIGTSIYCAGSIACLLSRNIPMLTAARVLQAMGGSAGMVVTRGIVRDLFDERESARMFSHLMLVLGLAPILAPTIGSQISAHGSWRLIFVVLTVFSALCFVAAYVLLPETLPPERRMRGGIGKVLHSFGIPLRSRQFIGYALVTGFCSGMLFSYISGSSYVFIEVHHVSPQLFGVLFGLNAAGLIGAAQLNRWLLQRHSAERLLRLSVTGLTACGVLLLVVAASGFGGVAALWGMLFLCLFHLGIVFPNVAALALAPFGKAAGGASSLLGTTQFLIGGLAGALVGVLHSDVIPSMATGVAVCGVIALVILITVAPKTTSGKSQETR